MTTLPIVEFSTSTTSVVESDETVIKFEFNVTGDLPTDGLPISLSVDGNNAGEDLWIVEFNNFSRTGLDEDTGLIDTIFLLRGASGVEGDRSFRDIVITDRISQPFDNIPIVLTQNTGSFELTVFDDFYAEGDETIFFSLSDGPGYESADDTPIGITIEDDPNLTDVPVVSLSIDAPNPLIEDLPGQKEVTFNFTVDETLGAIPAEGLPVLLESDTFDILGDFVRESIVSEGLSTASRLGAAVPVEFGRGFIVTIEKPAEPSDGPVTASLTVDIANDNIDEGIQDITFDLVDGEAYDVGEVSASITIQDPPTPIPIVGTRRNDILIGGIRNNIIEGRGGKDRLLGRGENDTIDGGKGNDTLLGRDGADSLEGGQGRDSLVGGNGNDFAAGGKGSDTLLGGDGDDTLLGGGGKDLIVAGEGRAEILGGAGDDTIRGGENDSIIDGGAGDDRITAGVFSDETVTGGAGDDTIIGNGDDDLLFGDAGKDRILGGDDEDSISGGADNDVILGGADNDLLSGDGGNDRIFGGDGDDLLMGVTGRDTLRGDAGSDTFVFGNGDGRDLILDFENGVDKIGLVEGELTFDDLKITRVAVDLDLRIRVKGTGETLARIEDPTGVVNLTEADFVTVPDVSDFSIFL